MNYAFTTELYQELLAALYRAIDGRDYYTGRLSITLPEGGEALLICTCFVCWRGVSAPDGRWNELRDLIPVWWEMHTFDAEGNELLNDYSFEEMRDYLG